MKVSYINCDFCHVSTMTEKEAVMFTNVDRKAIGGREFHICDKCVIDVSKALEKRNESFSLRGSEEGRLFREVKS